MWSDPLGRLTQSLLYHSDYAQSAHVREYSFPSWQPLIWLLESVPWHPGVFVVALDPLIAVLAALGLGRLWRKYRVFALWLAIGFGFLLIWPTKWPQYILTITVPVCLAAAEGFQGIVWEPLLRWLARHRSQDNSRPDPAVKRVVRREARRAMPWLVPGVIALGLLAPSR